MAPPLEISIPTTTLSPSTPPYTLYNITLRLPLRTFIVQKRYSDFACLDTTLRSQIGPPPSPLPSKSWPLPFTRTSTDPGLVEERRKDLERYLQAIAETPDGRWRGTSVWRAFLNLPSNSAGASGTRGEAHGRVTALADTQGGGANLDAKGWLDVHREVRTGLHDARLWLGKRDAAGSGQAQHEAGANAKRCLVKGGGLIAVLEEGLGGLGLGEGELRRRRDLVNSAKVEKEGLEKLALSLAVKSNAAAGGDGNGSGNGSAAASSSERGELFGKTAPGARRGRVLGAPQETDRTRELGNEGVLQLQRQMMQEQDVDVEALGAIVRRQKEMGIAISEELEVQNEMLGRLDGDVDRVGGKIGVAKKRMGKIR